MSIFGYTNVQSDNTVVGNYNGKVIVKQDDDELFFCEMPDILIRVSRVRAPDSVPKDCKVIKVQ